MKYGFVMPGGDARDAANLAYELDQAGWDGFFVSEPVWGVDAWVCLTAAAVRTERIRLGTMLSPLSRMRPWKIASEAATLDNLSNGRVILAAGVGAPDTGFDSFGEVTDRKTRAELLDECLDIMTGLWRGQPFTYAGKHYAVKETTFNVPPPPLQKPRIPIWIVGAWPHTKSMRRALRYDGLIPQILKPLEGARSVAQQAGIDDLRAMRAYVEEHRAESGPFDIVVEGKTPGDDPVTAGEKVAAWAKAGATWWIEARWEAMDSPGEVLKRASQGPPSG
jgi:alkanesulfonate monooxygenase SsuD/methylene tetrahydromethanopterin reductase-like flavin-dependent oxidoreductase (luciferase family)